MKIFNRMCRGEVAPADAQPLAPTIVMLSLVLLAACRPEVPPTVIAPAGQGQTGGVQAIPVLATATSIQPTAAATTPPTAVPLYVSAFRHRTGVFAINLPERWETLDDSTDQRIYVRLLPPMGYGSRITVEITNEGPLPPEETKQLAESYVRLNYVEAPGYNMVTNNELPDGRLQYVFLFDDKRGATGRETLVIQQTGPFFAAIRIFLSDRDSAAAGLTLEQVAGSFTVDPLAPWGTQVAAINPAELQIANTLLWRDRGGTTFYGGELMNASPADISGAQIAVSFCDKTGVVISQMTQPLDVHIITKGTVAPWGIAVKDLPDGVTVCSQGASAQPAKPDPNYTTAAVLNAAVSYQQWRRDLTVEGPITNLGLARVMRIEVIIVAYDVDNRVIGYLRTPLDSTQPLDPGQSIPFSVVIPALGGQPHHMTTMVQAQVVSNANPSLAPTPTPGITVTP